MAGGHATGGAGAQWVDGRAVSCRPQDKALPPPPPASSSVTDSKAPDDTRRVSEEAVDAQGPTDAADGRALTWRRVKGAAIVLSGTKEALIDHLADKTYTGRTLAPPRHARP